MKQEKRLYLDHHVELAPQDAERVGMRKTFGQKLSDAEVTEKFIQRLTDDFEFYCLSCVTIVNNNPYHPTARMGQIVPFTWNAPQRRLARLIAKCIAEGRPWLFVIPKARQWGCTRMVSAAYDWVKKMHGPKNVQVLAQDSDSTTTLFEMYEETHNRMVEGNEDWCPTMTRGSRKTGYALSNGSKLRVQTAGTAATAKKVGRSKTNDFLHLSEEAFWEAAKRTLVAILQTVALGPWKGIIRESSPNGASGSFYQCYMDAKRNKNGYYPFFVPWHEIDWYRLEPTEEQLHYWEGWRKHGAEEARKLGGFEPDPNGVIKANDLTCGQWLWWGQTFWDKCDGDIDMMRQEYPDDDVTCFLRSGSPVFKPDSIDKCLFKKEPQLREMWVDDAGSVQCEPHGRGFYKFWYDPVRTGKYILPADVCSGHASRDESVAGAWRRTERGIEQCAVVRGHMEPDELASMMWMMGKWFGNAPAAPEVNTYGLAVLEGLKRRGYSKFYRRRHVDEVRDDMVKDQLGWYTSARTRALLIAAGKRYLNNQMVVIHDEDLADQLRTFVKNPKTGKEEAGEGALDDYVMMFLIACKVDEDTRSKAHASQDYIDSRSPKKRAIDRAFGVKVRGRRGVSIADELRGMGW